MEVPAYFSEIECDMLFAENFPGLIIMWFTS